MEGVEAWYPVRLLPQPLLLKEEGGLLQSRYFKLVFVLVEVRGKLMSRNIRGEATKKHKDTKRESHKYGFGGFTPWYLGEPWFHSS